jgi:hypothetical protein
MATLALIYLFDASVASFAADSIEVPQVFGWREPARRPPTLPRIAWVPGDDGDVGKFGPVRQPGRNPRSLGTLLELATVYIEAQDKTEAENERKQYIAARTLFDAWWRTIYQAGRGVVTLESLSWVDERKERRAGATLRAVLSVEAMIPDEVIAVAPAGARAVVDVELLDVSEQIETAPAPPQAEAATTEAITLAGAQTIDGIALFTNDLVLVKNQTDASENGIYEVAVGAWTRSADELAHGSFVHVVDGDINGDAGFVLTTADPIVIDTTPLTFERAPVEE